MHFKTENLEGRDQVLLVWVGNYLQSVKRKWMVKNSPQFTSIKPILIYFQTNQLMGDDRFTKGNS